MNKWLKIFTINLFILTLGLIAIECYFGGWFDLSGFKSLYKLNIPINRKLEFKHPDLYPSTNKMIHYTRDQYGLRGHFPNIEKIKILTIGGSTTDQRYLDDTKTWQAVLQNKFLKNKQNIYIANAGIDGQSTVGHIQNFKIWFPLIPKLAPKYVLFYIGINDLYLYGQNDDIQAKKSKYHLLLKEKSILYYLLRTFRGIYIAKHQKVGHGKTNWQDQTWIKQTTSNTNIIDKTIKEKLLQYQQRIKILAELTYQMEAIPIFVNQATREYKIENHQLFTNGTNHYYLRNAFNKALLETCHSIDHAICIDLAKELQFEDHDFYDVYHNTAEGAEKIGNYLYDKLKTIYQ